ncbi:tryptophan-rich sensory protein [Candidatus Woesearchaeota archaeon]|nr:tryptophan-rich sensory protein [Candidatus Woesearchaeota archaeon]
MKNYIKLLLSVLISLSAGFIGSIFTSSSVSTWYITLNKPVFNPPSWVFSPVWTALYILMGISLYLIWTNKKKTKLAFTVFGIQLFLNALWSVIFFGLRNPLLAFIEIIILWCAILYTIIIFYRINKNASYLLIPYILWVSFAAVLNLYLVMLN